MYIPRTLFLVATILMAVGSTPNAYARRHWYKVNRHDLPHIPALEFPKIDKNNLKINRHDIVPDALKISRHEIGGTTTVAWHQLHDGTVRLGHQTATNFRSVSDYIDARMKGFCETMGPDEDCVDGVGAKVDDQGNVETWNPTTGKTYPVTMTDANTVSVDSLPQIIIAEPRAPLSSDNELLNLSDEYITDPVALWPLPFSSLPPELQADVSIKEKWNDLQAKVASARISQVAGRVRPLLLVPSNGIDVLEPGEVVRRAYKVYSTSGTAKAAFDAITGRVKPTWLSLTTSVAVEALSPEQIRKDDLIVLGLFPEEKAALDAANVYYDALPPAVKLDPAMARPGSRISAPPPKP